VVFFVIRGTEDVPPRIDLEVRIDFTLGGFLSANLGQKWAKLSAAERQFSHELSWVARARERKTQIDGTMFWREGRKT
jgi:hypothetical protein